MNLKFCSSILTAWLYLSLTAPVFAAPKAPAAPAQITLSPGVPIWINAAEPAPVQRAAQDLARDFRKVLGAASPISHNRAALGGRPFIEVLGSGAGTQGSGNKQTAIVGNEAHGLFVKRDPSGTRVVLQGVDMRGTIYAIYTFSEKFLGVKPLWFWASQPPLPQKSIVLPITTSLRFAPPTVRWRAWLPNDTDLFDPWKNKSQTNYDALYEAMLRLKLNTLEGNVADQSSLNPPYLPCRAVQTAHDRGLAYVGHHINPLGSDYGLWDGFWRKIEHREPPALSVNDVESLKTFWRWHIQLAQRNHLEEIWLIGFRGKGDHPFWNFYPDAPKTDKERAAVIESMMKVQVQLVKEVTGQTAPIMRATLYNELSDFYAAGLLRPPSESNLIWTFVATRRDHYPGPDAQKANLPPGQPVGYYMNFQFTSSGAHLAQAEGPWKMERNYRFMNGIGTRPLEFSVVNMGNIREFVLEGSANAALLWNMKTYDSDKFLSQFCRTYFGDENGPAVDALYHDFYASYWQQRRPNLPGFERQFIFQDLRLNQTMQRLIGALQKPTVPTEDLFDDGGMDVNGRYFNIVPADNGTTSKLDAVIAGTNQSIGKLTSVTARADALLARLPQGDRTFFNDNLRVQARFLLAANQTTHNLALAVRDKMATDKEATNKIATVAQNNSALSAHLQAAQAASQQMHTALAEAEHGVFAGWYDSDGKFAVTTRIKEIAGLLQTK